jgi:aminopeptidase YwaD
MGQANRGRSPYTGWYVALLILLLLALGFLAFAIWARDGVSCTEDLPSSATATLPRAFASTTPTTAPPPAPTTTTEPAPIPALAFDGAFAMSHIKALAEDIGPRRSGGDAEGAAVSYAAEYLQSLGYSVEVTEVSLPDARVSHNVRAVKAGVSASAIVLGAHIDTKASAPGGNDNASGVAVVLELARDLRGADTAATIEFVLFGAEEMVDSNADHHHYGSRQFVQSTTAEQRSSLVGMISVDMVGYGSEFTVRTMGSGPQLLKDMLMGYSTENGLPALYSQDTGTYGWSDHEPFELAGYPAVWLEWRDDPTYHTQGDTYGHCDQTVVQQTGTMLVGFLMQLTNSDLEALASTRVPR